MGQTVIAPDRDRAIISRLEALGVDIKKASPSVLRVSALADSSRSQYLFNIQSGVGSSLRHDTKLDQNDAFAIHKLGLFLMVENPGLPGTGRLQTYPNKTVFAPVLNEVNPDHLEIFYNASYRVKVNETVHAEAIPTLDMTVVRTSQQAAASTFSEKLGEDGFVNLPQTIIVDGGQKNEITLNVPTFGALQIQHVTAASRIYVVFVAKGFLITGGASK